MFCGECGHSFSEEKKPSTKEETIITKNEDGKSDDDKTISTFKMNWSTIIIILAGVGLLAGILVPYQLILSTENVPYEATEEYTVKEPYSYTETYYEEVPYMGEECEYRTVLYDKRQDFDWVDEGEAEITCKITNYEAAVVTYKYTLSTYDKNNDLEDMYGPRTILLGVGDSYTVKKTLDASSPGTYMCEVQTEEIKDCRTVTKFRDVRKERTVTKYHDVVKTRSVTKIRIDTVYAQVNWLFGVKMPWLAAWREEGEVKWYYPVA